MDDDFYNRVNADRIASRQIDELIGLAKGLTLDGRIDDNEVEWLHKWLAANTAVSDQPLIRTLYRRIEEILADGIVDADEKTELLDTLRRFTGDPSELGESVKATTLPLCNPAPVLRFSGQRYCFSGVFNFGQRKDCEKAVLDKGASVGGLSQKTSVLVIGIYATDSWKHASFGNKILQAVEWRDRGIPISIVSEEHWMKHLG